MSYGIEQKENCLKELLRQFKTLGSSIIHHVSEQNGFDVHKSNMALKELTGAVKIQRAYSRLPRIDNADQYISIDQIEEIIDEILTGARVLIILRGMPGSGKSHLAKSILRACYPNPNYKEHIHSSDDFFMRNGKYMYNITQIGEAHQWNKRQVDCRMRDGYSPLIIDNTNTRKWEMSHYAHIAVINGYKIHVLEMNTRWAFNCKELIKKNKHNVPKQTIQAMLERYEMGITAENLLNSYQCTLEYQTNPTKRKCPPFPHPDGSIGKVLNPSSALPRRKKKNKWNIEIVSSDQEPVSSYEYSNKNNGQQNGLSHCANQVKTLDTSPKKEKSPFSFSWETDLDKSINFWTVTSPKKSTDKNVQNPEKKHTSEIGINTCMEDFKIDTKNLCVIYGRNREICDSSMEVSVNKTGMLDKGCSTQDDISSDRNEDLKKLIDIFQNVPPLYIRDMYDDCKGNFDMTFEIFLEDNKDYSHLLYNIDNVIRNTNEVQEENNENQLTRNISEESLEEACALPKEYPGTHETLIPKVTASTGAIKKYSVMLPINKSECKSPNVQSDEENTCESPVSEFDSDMDTGSSTSKPESENIELNLGQFLVKQLEKEFGDPSNNFPDGFQPVIQLPRGLARQLYAFYVESAFQQMETQQSILDKLVKEDEAFARKLYEEEIGVIHKPPPEGLLEIMNEQVAMKIHNKQLPKMKTPNDLATNLSKKKLFESFPSVDQDVILELYHANGLDYKQTVEDLINSVKNSGLRLSTNIREPPISLCTIQELERAQENSMVVKIEKEADKRPTEYREEAEYYLNKRNELYQKAQEYYSSGQREVAQFYSQLAQQQTQYYDIANNKAASVFLDENSRQLQNMDTLDLHYLFVKEAIAALDVFIDRNIEQLNRNERKLSQDLLIITGRGKRSPNGVSKIKPAVIRRLDQRKIKYVKMNPGLLKIKIKKNTPFTNNL